MFQDLVIATKSQVLGWHPDLVALGYGDPFFVPSLAKWQQLPTWQSRIP
jgi:hypothetical protein